MNYRSKHENLVTQSREIADLSRKCLKKSRELIELGRVLIESCHETVRNCAVTVAASKLNRDTIKKCSCGEGYTLAQWQKMKYIGWQTTPYSGELRNCACESTLLFVTNRREDRMQINPGDKIKITCQGRTIDGKVLTAVDYGTDGKSNWYIEFERPDNRYGYWKQGPDGGTVEKVEE